MEALFRCVAPVALLAPPFLLARILVADAQPTRLLASIGPCAILLNLLVPLGLHLAGVPITRASLLIVHAGLLLFALGALRVATLRSRGGPAPSHDTARRLVDAGRPIAALVLLYAVAVIPVTHIAGIDTYKWQDLATAVAMERAIPWLVHPLSLLGFTPRAYPPAQPLVLASVQILGHTGVDWGFYWVSLLTGFTAITGAYALGRRVTDDATEARCFAFLYGFSPVLMRYGYWATGRGFLLALLPLFVLLLLDARRFRSSLGAAALGVLLVLSHKAGLIAVILLPAAVALSPLLAACRARRAAAVILLMAAALAGLLLTPGPLAWMVRWISRFGCLAPLALLGVLAAPWTDRRERRAMLAAALLTTPLAFADDPYGALLAVPFVAGLAAAGVTSVSRGWGPLSPARLRAGVLGCVLLAACVVIVRQAMDSPSQAVYEAARFLEAHDPLGPYRIDAPGRTRTRMQAYLSGCPRFRVEASGDVRLAFTRPPALTGNWRDDAGAWTRWLRGFVALSDSDVDWYGPAPRIYYVRVDGVGVAPPGARLLYDRGGVMILTPP